jgi:hypothetical protein
MTFCLKSALVSQILITDGWQLYVKGKLKAQHEAPRNLRVCLGTGCFCPVPSCMLPCHQTSARLSSSYLGLYTLVSEHENKMTFYHKV